MNRIRFLPSGRSFRIVELPAEALAEPLQEVVDLIFLEHSEVLNQIGECQAADLDISRGQDFSHAAHHLGRQNSG